jgi:Matrixin
VKRTIVWLVVALIMVNTAVPASAYLKFGVSIGGTVVDVKWTRPVPYFVTDRPVPGVSVAALRDTVMRAFATWQRVSTARIQSQFQGLTIASPEGTDGRTTIGFLDRPELDRVLGATSFLLDGQTGEILEADIFFNTRFDWSTTASGEAGRVDVESIAVHEIGHLLGLGHSAIGETEMSPGGGRRVIASGAVMFPLAMTPGSIADRELQPDDVAGISDLYPAENFRDSTSSISGQVTKNGLGVYGAHVTAFNLETSVLIGGFVLSDRGEYVIGGLSPGTYIVRAEPLDEADTDSFLPGPIDVDFRAVYSPRIVVAPRGGTSEPVDIAVRPK